MNRRLWRLLAALFAMSLFAAACAGDDDDSADGGDGGGGSSAIDDVDVFFLPPVGDSGETLLTAGTLATAFSNDPDTMAALEYMATAEYVEARLAAGVGGFLSANNNVGPDAYSGFEAQLVDILKNAEVARFDGSDSMPGDVGSGAFWTGATDIVSESKSVAEAFADIEAAWPSDAEGDPDCPAPEEVEGDGVVTIFGPEVEDELAGFQQAMAPFTEATGIRVEIQGDRGFSEQIGVQVEGGNPPDIAIFAQPGRVRDFARQCDLVPLSDDVVAAVEANFEPGFISGGLVGGELYGVPNKSDVKSLVWYSPSQFEEKGYTVPATHDELIALADEMVANGDTPLCIGIGSDAATGWPFTDWMEDYMLRVKGPDVYDQWVNHEIPFDDPQVVEVGEFVMDLWTKDGYVFGGLQTVASTPFADAGLGVIEGDCMMHRQANFFAAQWPDDVTVGSES